MITREFNQAKYVAAVIDSLKPMFTQIDYTLSMKVRSQVWDTHKEIANAVSGQVRIPSKSKLSFITLAERIVYDRTRI